MSDEPEATILAAAIGIVEALQFYADPDSYFGLMIVGDAPCGQFARDAAPITEDDVAIYDDFRDGGAHYGKLAREALAAWRRARDG